MNPPCAISVLRYLPENIYTITFELGHSACVAWCGQVPHVGQGPIAYAREKLWPCDAEHTDKALEFTQMFACRQRYRLIAPRSVQLSHTNPLLKSANSSKDLLQKRCLLSEISRKCLPSALRESQAALSKHVARRSMGGFLASSYFGKCNARLSSPCIMGHHCPS